MKSSAHGPKPVDPNLCLLTPQACIYRSASVQHQRPEQHQQNTAGAAHQLSPTLLTISLSQIAAVLLSSDQETSPGLHCSLSPRMRLLL